MKQTKWFLFLSLMVIVLLFSGCTKNLQEVATEKMVKDLTNGEVTIDLTQGQTQIETEAGLIQIGENIGVPAEFPSDVYLVEGTVKSSYKNSGTNGWTVSLETDKSIAEVKSLYQEKLVEAGWKVDTLLDMGISITIGGSKDNRTVSVMIASDEESGKTSVLVGSSENE